MILSQALIDGKRFLKGNNIEQYALDAELIMMFIMGFTKVELFTKNDAELSDNAYEDYRNLLEKRAKGVPLQYITGECEFMSLPFIVNENVLVPRPDTETLVEKILECIKSNDIKTVMDIGTGTGCIPISLIHYGDIDAYAVDISIDAIEIAIKNAKRNNVEDKICFINSNLFESVPEELYGKIDVIVSNPPYIPTGDLKGLMREVRDNEPIIALDGGKDGLYFYKRIVSECGDILKSKGYLFFEIGYNQGDSVSSLMVQNGFENIEVIKDLYGNDRVVCGKRI